jgi:hypothetical protein
MALKDFLFKKEEKRDQYLKDMFLQSTWEIHL